VRVEAGLVATRQRGRTVRFEAIGVGQGAVDAGWRVPAIYSKGLGQKKRGNQEIELSNNQVIK
jgi:hypothetical protein